MTRRQFIKKFWLSGTLAGIISAYPFFIERYLVQINDYQVPVPNLPEAFENFRIVHLTDLHYGFLAPEIFIESIVEKANRINKDMVVCTGDYVHERNNTEQLDTVFPILGRLKAKYGAFSVLGNHDHWADFERSVEWLDRIGQNLRHRAVSIEKAGERIWFGGAGDLWEDFPGIDKIFINVPDKGCKILLAHNPDTADTRFKTRIDLMISGHTHRGSG